MRVVLLFALMAVGINATPVLESTCSITEYIYHLGFVKTTTTTGTSTCTLREAGASAHAESHLSVHPTYIVVDTYADAFGATFEEEDRELGASASSLLEYQFIARTPGPVRPGLLYVDSSWDAFEQVDGPGKGHAGAGATILLDDGIGDRIGVGGGCTTTDDCDEREWLSFTLGVPFTVTIRASASATELGTGSSSRTGSGAGAVASMIFFFAEPGPCPDNGCNTSIGGLQIVPSQTLPPSSWLPRSRSVFATGAAFPAGTAEKILRSASARLLRFCPLT